MRFRETALRSPARWRSPDEHVTWIALAFLLASGPCAARTVVLRPDGTGDVPTFQAGIDRCLASSGLDGADTLLVEAGSYDEDAEMDPPGRYDLTILCPSGPEATTMRSLRGFNTPPDPSTNHRRLKMSGLGLQGPLEFGGHVGSLTLNSCKFVGDFLIARAGPGEGISDSEFRGTVYALGYAAPLVVRRCRFLGGTARFVLGPDWPMYIEHCTFSGGDTAAVAIGGGGDGMQFSGCVFTTTRTGVFMSGDQRIRGVTFADCRFEGIEGAAIDCNSSSVYMARLDIRQSRFEKCGSAVAGSLGPVLDLELVADTVLDCRGIAIEVNLGRARMSDVIVKRSGQAGVILRHIAGAESAVHRCRFEDNAGPGLVALRTWGLTASENLFMRNAGHGFESAEASVICRNNTSVLNGGDGFRLWSSEDAEAVENNIAAANGGRGIAADAQEGVFSHNDAWMNGGADYAGSLEAADNLTLDPQFCDPLAGDFRVAASSPCAPSGPYGQIGALGVGCDAMTVPLDVEDHPVNLRANAPVEAAILAHRLFDPRTVDVSTVRLAGAPPAPRGRRGSDLRDVNQDGLTDLLLSFDARDLRLEGGEAYLQGRTRDGAPFRGSDVVEVKNLPLRAALGDAATVEIPSRLALSVRADRGVGEVRLLLDLPSSEPARIEVFDVAGRRLQSSAIASLVPGRHAFTLTRPLKSGLYLVRLSQGAEAIVGRAVVLR